MPERMRFRKKKRKEPKAPAPTTDLERLLLRHWDIVGLANDLQGEKWYFTEPNRIDRRIFVASWDQISEAAKDSMSEDEWAKAETDGVEHEIVEEYIEALADMVKDSLDEHVYGITEDSDVFLGQYEDGDPEELKHRYEVGD